MVFISCSKDDISTDSISSVKEEIMVHNFLSEEIMENKIDEVISLKEKKEKIVLDNFKSLSVSNKILSEKLNPLEQSHSIKKVILKDLELYHTEKLKGIYELRKELNFTSIQSIAEEINSLILVNPSEAKYLFDTHQKFLVKNKIEVETIFDDRSANVINDNGEVFVKGKKSDLKKPTSTNITGKYLGDESIKSGIAAYSGEYFIYYLAGREVHKNFIGVRYFRYFTQLKSYMATPNGLVACPSTFTVSSGSIAGFVQTGSQFFSDYAFSYNYPSGYGTDVRFVGGNKNTPYIPAGGKIAGTFSTTIGGVYQKITCDMKYTE